MHIDTRHRIHFILNYTILYNISHDILPVYSTTILISQSHFIPCCVTYLCVLCLTETAITLFYVLIFQVVKADPAAKDPDLPQIGESCVVFVTLFPLTVFSHQTCTYILFVCIFFCYTITGGWQTSWYNCTYNVQRHGEHGPYHSLEQWLPTVNKIENGFDQIKTFVQGNN